MQNSWAINNAIPGLGGLTSSATGIIQNALSGLPSPSESRLANAYFGAGSGMDPTSDFLRNRGYDLYKGKANQRQQQGMQDLLSLVGTYSGNVAPTPGQEMQNTQFGQNLAQQGSQFDRNLGQQSSQFQQNFGFEQEQWKKQLELLNQYLGPAGGSGNYGAGTGTGIGGGSGYGNVAPQFGGYNNAGYPVDTQGNLMNASGGLGTPPAGYGAGAGQSGAGFNPNMTNWTNGGWATLPNNNRRFGG